VRNLPDARDRLRTRKQKRFALSELVCCCNQHCRGTQHGYSIRRAWTGSRRAARRAGSHAPIAVRRIRNAGAAKKTARGPISRRHRACLQAVARGKRQRASHKRCQPPPYQTLSQNHGADIGSVGSQSDSHANFMGPLCDGIRHHTVDAYRSKRQRDQCEDREQQHVESLFCNRSRQNIIHGS
jgi:hypothetical protein